MATVTIMQPKNICADATKNIMLTWTSSLNGQTAYEVIYKLKEAQDWSTFGKVVSTSQSFDLSNLYRVMQTHDIREIYYRVLVYFTTSDNQGDIVGKAYSDVYSIIFLNGVIGHLNIYDGKAIRNYPIMNEVKNYVTTTPINIQLDSNKKAKLPLVDQIHPLADKTTHIHINGGDKCFAKASPTFAPSNIYGNGEFDKYVYKYTPLYNFYDKYLSAQYNYKDHTYYYTKYKAVQYYRVAGTSNHTGYLNYYYAYIVASMPARYYYNTYYYASYQTVSYTTYYYSSNYSVTRYYNNMYYSTMYKGPFRQYYWRNDNLYRYISQWDAYYGYYYQSDGTAGVDVYKTSWYNYFYGRFYYVYGYRDDSYTYKYTT